MGNESSKQGKSSASLKTPFSLKSGPSSTVVQRHLENARKTRVLQLKETGLKVIPTALEEVADILRNLDVSRNKLRQIPSMIGTFTALRHLHLSNNLLDLLPDEIGCIKTLELLNISHNALTSLPETLIGCSSLKNVIASHNKMIAFPIVIAHLPSVEIVDLSSNLIEIIPEEIESLQAVEFNMNQNRLNTIHPNISKCPRLKIFRVEENCLQKNQFCKEILENSQMSLIAYSGNLFQEKDFQCLPGYETYQERFTATKRKGV